MSTPHKILPNLILALSAWRYNFESDETIFTAHKNLILDLLETLQELDNLMKQLSHLHENTTDNYVKYSVADAITTAEDHESKVYGFISESCGEMIAWKLADPSEVFDEEEDVEEDDDLYAGIFDHSIGSTELCSDIKNGNEQRRSILDEHS